MKKQSAPNFAMKAIENGIRCIVANKDKYVKRPGVDFSRERKLPMDKTLRLMFTMGETSLNKEIFNFSERTKIEVTSSAFIQQRKKITTEAYRDLFHLITKETRQKKLFYGYHLLAADGSAISMSRDPKAETFIQPARNPIGYNQFLLNALYDIQTHTYLDVELQPGAKMDERAALINILRRNTFDEKTIIVVDRGYESYNMFANFIETNGVDFVCRVKDGGSGAMAEIRDLPMQELDRDVSVAITTTQTNDDKKHHRRYIQVGSKTGKPNSPNTHIKRWDFDSPYLLKVRVVRFLLDNGKYETIVTSLPRNIFSAEKFKEIYHMRWGIETSFRELKYFTGLIALHGKSDEFVAQEIYVALTIYNLCTFIMAHVPVRNSDKNTHIYQINYAMAFFLCRNYYRQQKTDGEKLIEDIGKHIEPIRPGRSDKRKMRPKVFMGFLYRIAA